MSQKNKIKVNFIHRRPRPHGTFSIEWLYAFIRSQMPSHIECKISISKYESNGLFKRLYNLIEAAFWKSDLHHITGDVHFLAFSMNPKKTLLTIHDCFILYQKSGLGYYLVKWFWFDIPVRRCARVIAVSEATKRDIMRFTGCPPEKIRVIHNPINPDYKPVFKPFNAEKPVLLQIGSAPNKNLERLAEALAGIPCHLRIIGKLSETQQTVLESHKIDYSSVFNISNEEMRTEYAACDLVVFVSLCEGFGMPVTEAQATGRPVLTSNLSSLPEVSGDAACLVNPCDVNSIREGLLKIIHDEAYRKELIRKGFENIMRFSPEKIVAAYCGLYEEVYQSLRS